MSELTIKSQLQGFGTGIPVKFTGVALEIRLVKKDPPTDRWFGLDF